MTLQNIRAASSPAYWDDVETGDPVQLGRNRQGTPDGMDSWAAGNGSCPDDCHYCSGPETD